MIESIWNSSTGQGLTWHLLATTGFQLVAGFCNKSTMELIPCSQHRLILLQIKTAIIPISVPIQCHLSFKKAKWQPFSSLDTTTVNIKLIPENYKQFVKMLCIVSKRPITRGCRMNYMLGLTPKSANRYKKYHRLYEADPFAEKLLLQQKNWLLYQWKKEGSHGRTSW